jgi:hypothetical protein
LEVAKPFFEGGNDQWSPLSSASYLSVHWPLTDRIAFVGELPLAYGSLDPKYEDLKTESKLTLGNPYVGVKIQTANRDLSGQVGLRLPLASEEGFPATTIGVLSDFINRSGAYLEEMVPITGVLTYRRVRENGLLYSLTAGADTWIATGGGGNVETFGLYAGQGGYYGSDWSVTAGLAGRALLTEEGLDLADRTTHEVGLDLGYHKTRIQPTLFVRVPVDEFLGDVVNTVVGFRLRTRI